MKKITLSVLIATVAFTGILLLNNLSGVETANGELTTINEGSSGGFTTMGNKVGG